MDGKSPSAGSGTPEGSPGAPDLRTAVYAHLRAIAQNQMKGERAGHTLSATALVHEAYLRLAAGGKGPPVGRAEFVFAAAEAMRRILIEHARARGRVKRGGEARRVSLDAIGDVADLATLEGGPGEADGIVAFDEAFERLEGHDERMAQMVRLRFYAGLSIAETAGVLGVSERTVNNDWAYARAWLAREMQRDGGA